ncbi:MAG TPA: maltose ABC transporter substrate-binding protein [Acidimicrobiia bacterium]|nr:maltose ABC transporter substrate-binding protein [Acidimicrobiia bacterium]
MKRRYMSLLGVIALVLAACGGGGTTTTTAVETTTTTAAVSTTTTAQETTSTTSGEETTTTTAAVRADADLVIWADDTRAPVITPFAEQFAADNGITVAVQELAFGDIRDRLIVAGPAGEGPDIIIGAHDWLGQLVAAGAVAPLDVSSVEDQFSEAALSAFNYEGQIYGLPYAVENIALVRNTDLVPEAPETFEEVVDIGLQLTEDGTVDTPLALQENGNGDPFHNYPIVTAFGGYVFGRNADGSYNPDDLGIDSEGSLAAAQYFGELSDQGVVNVDITYDIMIEKFSTGMAPFAITGPWALASFEGVNYVVEPIPPLQGGTPQPFIGVQGFMVSAFAENPLFASTFVLDFMATEEAQLALFEAGGRPPAHLGAFEQVAAADPNIEGFGLAGQEGYPMPAIPEMGSVWQAWTDAYELIFTGGDPEEAFRNAASQIRTLIEG